VLRAQFDLVWSLLDLHLRELTDEDCLWRPSEACWTVRPDATGRWTADWQEPEPDPAPVVTIGWLSWHVGWWWTQTLAHATATPVPGREEIAWPGSAEATVARLHRLRTDWLALLERLTPEDLGRTAPFPWQNRPDRTVAHMIGWVNVELMKNTAEIGQLRLLRLASGTAG
jgi:hypothetical protein